MKRRRPKLFHNGRVSPPIRQFPASGLREIADLAMQEPEAVRLDLGQPDFATPDHIAEAARAAINSGLTGYTQTAGLPNLRSMISHKLERVNGIVVDPESVVCGAGGVNVLAAAVSVLCGSRDEVLVPDPRWPNYDSMCALVGAKAVPYECSRKTGFLPDVDQIADRVTSRTRLIIVNSPCNPTGTVMPAEVLKQIAEIAERSNLWILSDEAYDEIVFEGSVAPSIIHHASHDRVICAYTFSKTHAMTGWRLGYAAAPEHVAMAMVRVLEATISCPSTIAQQAALAALSGPHDHVELMVGEYRRRRDLAVAILRRHDLLVTVPAGAFYILVDVARSQLRSREFAMQLLDRASVSVTPGEAFGDAAQYTVRVSLASPSHQIERGLERLADFICSRD